MNDNYYKADSFEGEEHIKLELNEEISNIKDKD